MPTVIGHHDISKGKDHWLGSPKREELFGALGVTNIRTFVSPQDPTQVALLMDVPDMDAFAAAMQNDAAADAMAHDGVIPESLVILVEEHALLQARRDDPRSTGRARGVSHLPCRRYGGQTVSRVVELADTATGIGAESAVVPQ